ncbi:MAG TPA: polysaccharide pyruvyl transferase family protein, partial [bacterium]|nr:polysaccharide pyruvyl transferase family protein [bacterium]
MDRQILLVGYFGFDNLGDELLLISLLDFIRHNFQDIKPLVLYGKNLPSVYGADVIPRKKLLSGIIKADGVCFSGGSIIQDTTSVRSLVYYLGIILLSFITGKPVIMVSQGFGPVKTWLGEKLIRILNLVYSISVRDMDSYKFLERSGIRRPKIYQGNDLVSFLDVDRFRLEDSSVERDVLV